MLGRGRVPRQQLVVGSSDARFVALLRVDGARKSTRGTSSTIVYALEQRLVGDIAASFIILFCGTASVLVVNFISLQKVAHRISDDWLVGRAGAISDTAEAFAPIERTFKVLQLKLFVNEQPASLSDLLYTKRQTWSDRSRLSFRHCNTQRGSKLTEFDRIMHARGEDIMSNSADKQNKDAPNMTIINVSGG